MFYRNKVVSIEAGNLGEFLKDYLSSIGNVEITLDDNDCKAIMTVWDDVSPADAFKEVAEQMNLQEDMDEYLTGSGDNTFKFSIDEFKPILENELNIDISSSCLCDFVNNIVYFFYTDREGKAQ